MKRKLRAVIDTNLFVSGLFARDALSARLQNLWINQQFELITSLEIIREVSRVLNYPRIKERFKPREENVRRFYRLIFRKAIISKDIYQTDKIVDDPERFAHSCFPGDVTQRACLSKYDITP